MVNKFIDFMNQESMKPFRFVLIGGAATFVHIFIASSILLAFQSVSPYLANFLAFIVAFVFSFYGHQYVTFRSEGSAWKFLVVAISGFLINNLMLTIMIMLAFSDVVAVMVATLCVPIFTYLASALWVFKKRKS